MGITSTKIVAARVVVAKPFTSSSHFQNDPPGPPEECTRIVGILGDLSIRNATMANLAGIDRNRTYTREEIVSRYGYDAQSPERTDINNRNRFFREHFLRRGLLAVPVGKTFEVNGEVWYSWTLSQSKPVKDDD